MKDEEAREGEQEEQLPAEDMCMNSWMEVATKYIELITIIGASDRGPLMSTPAAVLVPVVWMQEEGQRQEQEQD